MDKSCTGAIMMMNSTILQKIEKAIQTMVQFVVHLIATEINHNCTYNMTIKDLIFARRPYGPCMVLKRLFGHCMALKRLYGP